MIQRKTADHIAGVIVRRPTRDGSGKNDLDFERACLQHAALCAALKACDVAVTVLNADPQFPQGCCVADIAVVTDRLAVMANFSSTHPRQGEQQAVATALTGGRFVKFISGTGLLDTADVLKLDDQFFVALSPSTNQEGVDQLAFFLRSFGYQITTLSQESDDAPRLSAAAVWLGEGRILIREETAQNYAFLEYEKVVIPREEAGASAALVLNGTILFPSGFSRLRSELRLVEMPLIEVNVSEFEKTGGVLSRLVLPLPVATQNAASYSFLQQDAA